MAPLLDRVGSDDQAVAAGDVVSLSESEPVTLSGVIAQTTSTLYDTTIPAAPATTAAPSTTASADGPGLHETAYTTTTMQAPTTTAPPSTTAAPTTAAPTTATPTTAPPSTAAPTTTAAPPTTASSGGGYAYSDPRGTQVWYDLADCESGGNWSINTGNGYYGGLQFSLGSWQAVGGSGYPHQHPAAEQIKRGRMLQAQQGWEAWPTCSEKLGLR